MTTTLLTPNRRLAATLLKKYNGDQQRLGLLSWESLDILPFSRWIERLWHEFSNCHYQLSHRLLTAAQETIIWEELIRQSPASESLLCVSKTADIVKSAWGILKQWQVPLNHPLLDITEDSQTWLCWAKEFKRLCQKNNWLDENSLTEIIIDKIQNKLISLPSNLLIIGFTELSPLQKKLLNLAETCGTTVNSLNGIHAYFNLKKQIVDQPRRNIFRIGLTDIEAEIMTMARWAKSVLQQHEKMKNNITIGCIVPNLERIRDRVISIFSEVFSDHKTIDNQSLPFNISAGKRLVTFPIIHTAFQLLKLPTDRLTEDSMSHLLRSPFLGDAEFEQLKRAQFDFLFRKSNHSVISLQLLLNSDKKINLKKYCPRLANRLTHFLKKHKQVPPLLTIGEWIPIFIEYLTILGWPGERSLNSHEYQIVERFLEVIQDYRTFNTLLKPRRYHEALQYLNRLAHLIIFQPQSPDAPIQLLGILEAAGLSFDYSWVMGLDDTTFPASIKPNPFIPHRLQKILHMPHATAERELGYAKELMKQLIQNSNHLIFSYPQKNSECDLRASALINEYPLIELQSLQLIPFISYDLKQFQNRQLEYFEDSQAPVLQPHETIPTGVSLFKTQAACPFKAFAEIRLFARPLESSQLGLRNQDRGILLHKALELIWNDINDSTQLNTYSDVELKRLISIHIEQAIQLTLPDHSFPKRYLLLESNRLQQLIYRWLTLEKQRPPFKVISQEKSHSIQVGNLPITIRVDRIDELSDGSQLIIDYKTSRYHSISYWFSDRPEEPQLPLYCISDPAQKIGITFAEIHTDNIGFKGISKKDIDIESIKPIHTVQYAENRLWEEQIANWHKTLESIGNNFYKGDATVDPKNPSESCRYCDLHTLCRVYDT